jgi:hypothetical protein
MDIIPINDELILYRTQCKNCLAFLSNPFKYNYNPNKKEEIKVDRFIGDNINYHSDNEYNNKNNIVYSFIHCIKCSQKVGYWIIQASKNDMNNINKLFFFPKCVNMVKYDKTQVTEEQHRKFKQEEIFYNSTSLTQDVIDYAKEHIDNFIKNIQKLEKERKDAEFCYNNFDRKIISIKNFFIKNMQDKENAIHLNIDFSKDDEPKTKKGKIIVIDSKKEINKSKDNFDDKSNGKNNLNADNNNINENGGEKINNLNVYSGSDIYLDKKNNKEPSFSKKNNKEPSNNSKIDNNKKNKRKRK